MTEDDDREVTRTAFPTETVGADDAGIQYLTVGQRFGRYRIEQLLGRGGMGEVYKAEDLDSGRRVALKILLRSMARQSDRSRFLREGRLAAAVSHPHTVYVYGTEEIDGLPTITMELASGGTLKDRVRAKGPLEPTAAVDTILQVIAGLNAAARADVLHRDIKPSNCFVGLDGTVKIGDFGLSMSTLAHDETQLTLAGTFLGTPAFASPEQLRGRELDERSDIYSVGATLYYLLTGRPPFEDANVLALTTRVVDEVPTPVDQVRAGISHGLARVVSRSLAKSPADRPQNYQEFAKDLESYSSRAPTPAALGRRAVAGTLDLFAMGLIAVPLGLVFASVVLSDPSSVPRLLLAAIGVNVLPPLLYFGLMEGLWGASLGKLALGLRVIGVDRSAPGLRRAFVRATVYAVVWQLPEQLPALVVGVQVATLIETSLLFGLVQAVMSIVGPVALFSTMRSRNGFVTLHGLASGTRVVVRATAASRTTFDVTVGAEPAPRDAPAFGGFGLVKDTAAALAVGYDPQLGRPVWIHRLTPGVPSVDDARRDAGRPGRARWLAGRRSESEAWDVYEAFDGRPLLAFTDRPLPWGTIRHWLADLAVELAAAAEDGTVPPLALDRVWITPDGRARLLDWSAPDLDHPVRCDPTEHPPEREDELDAVARFLGSVTTWCLTSESGDKRNAALPLGAHRLFGRLSRADFTSVEALSSAFGALVGGPASVSRRDRGLHLAATAFFPIFTSVVILSAALLLPRVVPQISDTLAVEAILNELEEIEERSEQAEPTQADVAAQRALEVHLAMRVRAERLDGSSMVVGLESNDRWPMIERALTAHPRPTSEEAAEAARFAEQVVGSEAQVVWGFVGRALPVVLVGWLPVAAVVGLLAAGVFRGGLLLRLLGITLVTNQGEKAGRGRALGRAAVAWSPALIAFWTGYYTYFPSVVDREPVLAGVFWVAVVVFVLGALYAILDAQRGVQDRVAGTCLVPK